jgi:hypothetical protein
VIESLLKVELSQHARSQFIERNIREEWVARVLAEPEIDRDDPIHQDVRQALRRIADYNNRWPRVVYKRRPNSYFVLTAFFDRNAEKRK